MAKEIHKKLKGVRQPKFGETNKVLSNLEKHLMQKINQLVGQIRELEKNLPEDLAWCTSERPNIDLAKLILSTDQIN